MQGTSLSIWMAKDDSRGPRWPWELDMSAMFRRQRPSRIFMISVVVVHETSQVNICALKVI